MPRPIGLPPHPTIDIHTHILPPNWPNLAERYGEPRFVEIVHHQPGCARMMREGKVFREIQANCWDPIERLVECDRDRIDVQVLSTVPVMFSYWAKPEQALDLSRFLNDHLASIVQSHPNRFAGLGTVPLQAAGMAIAELERCVRSLGLCGVEIGTHVNGRNLGEPEFSEFFAAAESLEAAIFVHPWEMLGRDRMEKYWLPWLIGMPMETALAVASLVFSGTLERHPRLRIAFAHGGGALPALWGRLRHGLAVRPDLVAVDNPHDPLRYRDRMVFDTLVHDAAILRLLLELFGPDQLAVGSDYPFPLGEHPPGEILDQMPELPLSTRRRLLGGTAMRWLGWDGTEPASGG